MGQLPCTPHCAKCFCIPGQRVLLSPFSRGGSQDLGRWRGSCPKSWDNQWYKRASTLGCLPGWEACALDGVWADVSCICVCSDEVRAQWGALRSAQVLKMLDVRLDMAFPFPSA